ncbi:gliding motility protein [Streptomyces sp. NPDC006430]
MTTESETAAEGAEAEPAATEIPAAEAVEIPKQQSADVAADSEAGESART